MNKKILEEVISKTLYIEMIHHTNVIETAKAIAKNILSDKRLSVAVDVDLYKEFMNNFDCYTQVDLGNGDLEDEPAIRVAKFKEIVNNILSAVSPQELSDDTKNKVAIEMLHKQPLANRRGVL